ncbi:hypothetical protein P7C70_g9258, partial [Phenoliferia sp. Uapishka_3]
MMMKSFRGTFLRLAVTRSSTSFLPARLLPSTLPTRHLSTTSSLSYPTSTAGVGSGQGGRLEKDAAKADKEAKALKAKSKPADDKVKAKSKEKKEAEKEKNREKKLKEKVLKDAMVAKAKAKAAKPKSSLSPPKAPANAWVLYLADFIAEKKATKTPGEKLPSATSFSALAAPLYRSLSHSDRAALLVRCQEAKDAFPAKYEAWKASLTPEMIKEENAIRFKRRKLGLSHKSNLRVEGEPKRPLSSYFRFAMAQREAGLKDSTLSLMEQSKIIAKAWREITPEDKKALEDEYATDRAKYNEEKKAFDEEQAAKSGKSSEVEE